jgi:hypothetical protein
MPPYLTPAALDNGWNDFFETRLGHLETKIVLDVALIDGEWLNQHDREDNCTGLYIGVKINYCAGLSFPLSFLCLLRFILEQNSGIKDWMYGKDRVRPLQLNLLYIECDMSKIHSTTALRT